MNVSLSAKELMHVLVMAAKYPMSNPLDQDELLDKLKKPILTILDKEDERLLVQKFESWSLTESKKIEDLSQKNAEIVGVKPPKVAAMKGKR